MLSNKIDVFTTFSDSIKRRRWTVKEDLALLNFCKQKKKIFWRDIVEKKWISECVGRTPEALKSRYNTCLINLEACEVRMLKEACMFSEESIVFYKAKLVASKGRIKKEKHVGSIKHTISLLKTKISYRKSPNVTHHFLKKENNEQPNLYADSDSENLKLSIESQRKSRTDRDNIILSMISSQYKIPLKEINQIYFNVSNCLYDLIHVLKDNNKSLIWTTAQDNDLKDAIPNYELLTSLINEKGQNRVLKRKKFLEDIYEALVSTKEEKEGEK